MHQVQLPFFSKKIQEDTLLNIPAGYLNTSAVFIDILYGKGGKRKIHKYEQIMI